MKYPRRIKKRALTRRRISSLDEGHGLSSTGEFAEFNNEGASNSPIGVIVLAAGASTRMGQPKQLLRFEGQSLLRRAAGAALGSPCRPVVVVMGAHAALMRAELKQLAVQVVENPQWVNGMSSSIRVGITKLAKLSEEASAAVITVCDQPLVTPELITRLVETHRATNASIVASEYGETLGVPALFSRRLFPELCDLSDPAGAKQIINRFLNEVVPVPFVGGAFDIDTPTDYAKLQRGGIA